MNLTKSETNNAIVTTLTNVRPHSNADRLKLATVFGTQVVVGLDAKDGDIVLYFDSNLCLSHTYLHANNLYSNTEMNEDTTKKGYFGHNGKVKAQRFRGEVSNGYVTDIASIFNIDELFHKTTVEDVLGFKVGDEFTHVNGVEICSKYIIPSKTQGQPGSRNRTRKPKLPRSDMFKQHWDTKHLMRELHTIPDNVFVYIEEKIHGTSGRTGHMLCKTNRPWYKFWHPKQKWMILSGTRRRDNIQSGHMWQERQNIEKQLAPNLHKGETVYYEIFGHTTTGGEVQKGFSYGCFGGEYKAMLYRVTITTEDGFTVDFPRESVYHRAEELGLMKPILIEKFKIEGDLSRSCLSRGCQEYVIGNSAIANHIKEGVVIWFQRTDGTWTNLKHKSDEFLILESKQRDENIADVEDSN